MPFDLAATLGCVYGCFGKVWDLLFGVSVLVSLDNSVWLLPRSIANSAIGQMEWYL